MGEQLSGQAWQAWRSTVGEWLYEKVRTGGERARGELADAAPRLLAELSNEEILVDLKSFVGAERRSLARVIVYLVEIEERRVHLELGCSSMFDFCTCRLGFSEGEAFRRLTAARLVRRLPVLLDALASGRIHLSNLLLLRDLLTEANVDELIAAASGKTKREVEELVARMAPKPDFSQHKCEGTRASSSTSSPSAIGETSHVASEHLQADDVRAALLALGFRGPEADRALVVIDRTECDELPSHGVYWTSGRIFFPLDSDDLEQPANKPGLLHGAMKKLATFLKGGRR
ncbi:hypothetical protein AKJ09_06930 [Labilithrix luteola]|uniref:Uncharacterized protein n=1 Tax=Labilithrix luteola TaxID=1391654 RepID=A0A0K1Q3Q6_9BACT|nr:hypothetical protein AKJ09_06930 [Labilithrix luteola]